MAEPVPMPNAGVVVPVLYEDADVIVVNKPAGMVVQPGKGHTRDTLLNGLFARHAKLLTNLGARRDFGLLHRLDKDTSGVLVVAKLPSAYDQLRRDFEQRKLDKDYLALVRGSPVPPQGVVQARLKEVVVLEVKKSLISQQGEEAISAYNVLATAGTGAKAVSLVRVRIKTGRLHQIRAHMLFLRTPVLGDALYAPPASGKAALPAPPRLCLHAWQLGFKHPTTGRFVRYTAPPPEDLSAYGRRLGLVLPE